MSITSRRPSNHLFFDAQAATGAGTTVNVADWRHITIAVATANSANLTVKLQGSIAETAPAWASAAALDNEWDFVAMFDYEDAVLVEGDTGLAFTGTDDVRLLTVNVDGLRFINFRVTAYAAGDVTVRGLSFNNQ